MFLQFSINPRRRNVFRGGDVLSFLNYFNIEDYFTKYLSRCALGAEAWGKGMSHKCDKLFRDIITADVPHLSPDIDCVQ